MKIVKIHNATNDETIHAVIRMTDSEHRDLADFMEACKPGNDDTDTIYFPHGVVLVKRGYGWYHLIATNFTRGINKIGFAINRALKPFQEKQEKDLIEEMRKINPLYGMVDSKTAASINEKAFRQSLVNKGVTVKSSHEHSNEHKPVTTDKLQKLAERLSGKPIKVSNV